MRGWRASGQLDRLSKTSPSFRHAVRGELDEMWHAIGSRPACKQATFVQVKEFRPRVAYLDNEGSASGGPGKAPARCAGGGNFQFFVKRDGR